MKSGWETYKGKRIFRGRYANLTLEEIRAEVVAVEKEMVQQPLDSVLLLVDTAGTDASPEALRHFKNVALHSEEYVHKAAVLGVTGVKRMILEIIVRFSGMNLIPFSDEQEAKDWLVRD
jgi:Holliday junction resolvasome RuvABC endonuclease subunit